MRQKNHAKLATVVIPIVILTIFLYRDTVLSLLPFIPACSIYQAFDVYCPACGNTRSVTALLQGDLLTSLRYNIVPALLTLLLLLGYLELVAFSFSKPVRLLPRKLSFYLILIVLLILYFILRNFSSFLTP